MFGNKTLIQFLLAFTFAWANAASLEEIHDATREAIVEYYDDFHEKVGKNMVFHLVAQDPTKLKHATVLLTDKYDTSSGVAKLAILFSKYGQKVSAHIYADHGDIKGIYETAVEVSTHRSAEKERALRWDRQEAAEKELHLKVASRGIFVSKPKKVCPGLF